MESSVPMEQPVEPEVRVKKRPAKRRQQGTPLTGPDDKRKTPWYVTKIKELEDSIPVETENSYNEGFAEGYFVCMSKYGVLSKLQRRRVFERIKLEGPGCLKKMKRGNFQVPVPSI